MHMTRRLLISSLLILALFMIVSCAPAVVCKKPYIQVGEQCCLDEDDNDICDTDEPEPVEECETDCTQCPIDCSACDVQEVEVLRYVCSDGNVVASSKDCKLAEVIAPEPVKLTVPFKPITTNENNTPIEFVRVRPFCAGYKDGGNIYFSINRVSRNISFQVKESPDEGYKTVYTIPGTIKDNIFFAVCNNCYDADFPLPPDKVYLFRMKFDITKQTQYDFEKTIPEYIYSNEHIIDTREGSDYIALDCSMKKGI